MRPSAVQAKMRAVRERVARPGSCGRAADYILDTLERNSQRLASCTGVGSIANAEGAE